MDAGHPSASPPSSLMTGLAPAIRFSSGSSAARRPSLDSCDRNAAVDTALANLVPVDVSLMEGMFYDVREACPDGALQLFGLLTTVQNIIHRFERVTTTSLILIAAPLE